MYITSIFQLYFIDISQIHPVCKKKKQKGIEVTELLQLYSYIDFNPHFRK